MEEQKPTNAALFLMWEIEPDDDSPLHQLRMTPESPLITGEVVEMGGKKFVIFRTQEKEKK